jgi:hypothetical protein
MHLRKHASILAPYKLILGIPLALSLFVTCALAQTTIYRETLGRPADTGDLPTTSIGWADFISTGTTNPTTGNAGLNGSTDGRPNDVANVNAGPNADGTFDVYPRGIHFYLTGAGAPILSFTPEFSFDPAAYVAGSIVFSWYEANANALDTMQLAVRVGTQWYAHTTAHSTAPLGLGAFPTTAELKQVIYDPAAANWLAINFDGTYDGGSPGTVTDSSGPLSLGSAPGADLSGTITGFGLYLAGANGTRRWDTFQIDATLIPEPSVICLAGLAGLALLLRRRK